MDNLINIDTIWCFIAFLVFTLSMAASAKAWLDAAKAPKRCVGLRRRERLGAEATVSESPREWCRQAQRAPAHGKEYTP